MKRLFKLWYRKWIKGECRHFCKLCKYYDYCKCDGYLDNYDK